MWLLLQVADKYVHLVTSINNADTLITLIVPSIMIIFSNVRISVALSQFYRDRQVMLAQGRQTERTSGDAAADDGGSDSARGSSYRRSTGHQTSITLARATFSDRNELTAGGNVSFNLLQMKVGLMNTRILS